MGKYFYRSMKKPGLVLRLFCLQTSYCFYPEKISVAHPASQRFESIGQRAFSGCGRLCGTLELPAGVTAIEYGAFMGCDNLRYVVATGNKITTLGDSLFGEDGRNKLIYK